MLRAAASLGIAAVGGGVSLFGAGVTGHLGTSTTVSEVVTAPTVPVESVPVRELGALLRHHPAFGPPGTNVNFVRFPSQDRMEIRTYERGVEDETLSCGTGVLAGSAVGLFTSRIRFPLHAVTQGGFELEVADLPGWRWSLAGDARVIAEGDLLAGALASPAPPPWAGAPLA